MRHMYLWQSLQLWRLCIPRPVLLLLVTAQTVQNLRCLFTTTCTAPETSSGTCTYGNHCSFGTLHPSPCGAAACDLTNSPVVAMPLHHDMHRT